MHFLNGLTEQKDRTTQTCSVKCLHARPPLSPKWVQAALAG